MNRRHPPVPTTASVLPGAAVHIVLKADQPTGRTVQGVVRDVLTRGNHPRGIKVRLADGRVGRVQSMASSSTAASGSGSGSTGGIVEGMQDASIDNDDQDGGAFLGEQGSSSSYHSEVRPRRGGRRGGRGGGRFRGYGEAEEHDELPSQQIGLDAYVKEAKPRRKGKGNNTSTANEEPSNDHENRDPPVSSAVVTCPVCGAFEGDEAAVSHHVASHFDDSAL